MLKDSRAFSGFSVNDMEKAKEFYGQTLGLDISDEPAGLRCASRAGTRSSSIPRRTTSRRRTPFSISQ
jgi:catechol-2,3-dioxygenase